MKLFISYRFDDELFVHRVNYYLRKQSWDSYCYAESRHLSTWDHLLVQKIRGADKFVVFGPRGFLGPVAPGNGLGGTQHLEVMQIYQRTKPEILKRLALVEILDSPPTADVPALDQVVAQWLASASANTVHVQQSRSGEIPHEAEARRCARRITEILKGPLDEWIEDDGLPIGYPFDYEKKIIGEYYSGDGLLLHKKRLEQGCPTAWPVVPVLGEDARLRKTLPLNPVQEEEIGGYRPDEAKVLVDVRSQYHCVRQLAIEGNEGEVDEEGPQPCLGRKSLLFLEAGPRKRLWFNPAEKHRVGIVVSGGIAPGINAVVAGIVERHSLYAQRAAEAAGIEQNARDDLSIVLYRDGLAGVLSGNCQDLTPDSVHELTAQQRDQGGSVVGTSRFNDLLEVADPKSRQRQLNQIVERVVKTDKVNILYVIGGDGSMRAAHAIYTTARHRARLPASDAHHLPEELSVVAVPKTMDNDVLWVWQAFGFLSAVERAKQVIMQLQTEVKSNPRLCVIQLFGSDSGFVVSHAALATEECDAALIPEVPFYLADLSKHVQRSLHRRFNQNQKKAGVESLPGGKKGPGRTFGTVLLAETAIPLDAEDYLDDPSVGLEESEKQAIRRFIGSSFLTCDDLTDWKNFCCTIAKASAEDPVGFYATVMQALKPEVQGILTTVAELSTEPWNDGQLQALVIRDLNRVLRDVALGGNGVVVDDEAALLRDVIEDVQRPNSVEQLRTSIEKLVGVSVPFEAVYILECLKEDQAPEDLIAFEEHTRSRRDRLTQLLTYKRNRLLLDAAFPNAIRKCLSYAEPGRVYGQTPDELRTGGLKIVSRVLQAQVRDAKEVAARLPVREFMLYRKQFRVFTNEPRHLLRAIPPSVSDVIFGHRLGVLAVDNAMAGYTDFMVSQWMTEYVLVPLQLVVLGRKRVPRKGIFWKSVLARTGTSEVFGERATGDPGTTAALPAHRGEE